MGKIPDRLYVDKADRELYDRIDEEIFKSRTRKEQFLFALAYGVRNETKLSLSTREGFFLEKDLHPEDEALLNAVALHAVDSVDVLSDREQVFKIAEEYAHGGIRLLHDEITSGQHGSFYKHFEKELFELYKDFVR